ncbi:hypothetical protein NDU88_000782 [Pleurodeles waltl]|uniref:Uncharacterized protein n=1 Tax=Pleurodeles waltl TaxID=8319 RepID=A0AAV7NCX9_PLEWA|nr:hypothetical protein NDU88_000782 [Pleurodeles waltl]
MTQVVGATRWPGHEGLKAPQEPWPQGPEDKDQDRGFRSGACLKPCPESLTTRWAKPRTEGPTSGFVGAPEPKLTGEASFGPVDSQTWAPQGTAGWSKGAPTPVPDGGVAWDPEPKLAGEASPGRGTPRPGPLRVRQAGGRELPSQGPAGRCSGRCSLNTAMQSPRQRLPPRGPPVATESKLTGEALLGPVDFQTPAFSCIVIIFETLSVISVSRNYLS